MITVRGGTPLAEVERVLAEKRQMLAFEPPHFGAAATIGGAVAAGLSGPRRAAAGAVRDFVLGVRMMDGRGEDLSFGGRVMKNVAGYDVSRADGGGAGHARRDPRGVASRCCRSRSPKRRSSSRCRGDKAIETMNRWAGQPLPISATAPGEASVCACGFRARQRP